LLLHGGGLDATDWREVAPELAAAGYRVTAPDLRGCGESDWDPEARYGVEDSLADIDEWSSSSGRRPSPASSHGTTA
jgi:pimeloyl-ACP methyl ester carboxylesterase